MVRPKDVVGILPWYGGKGPLLGWILPHLPPHEVYCEPFGGGATVLLAKPPTRLEVLGDLDLGVVRFWRWLRANPDRAVYLWGLTEQGERVLRDCRKRAIQPPDDENPEWEWAWWTAALLGFAGVIGKRWSYSLKSVKARKRADLRWADIILWVAKRLQGVEIIQGDYWDTMLAYDSPVTLHYLDPPYCPISRREARVYNCEMSVEQHVKMVERLTSNVLKGMAVLSGYTCDVYAPIEKAGWVHKQRRTVARAAATKGTGLKGTGVLVMKQPRVESLWLSPRTVEALGL